MPNTFRDNPPASLDQARLYELLIAELPDFAVFLMDATGVVTSWNPGVERVLGFAADEWVSRHVSIIFTPEDRAANVPQSEMATAARDGRSPDVRWHVRKDGSRLFVDGTLVALRDDRGRLLGFSKVMRDVTERQQAADQLKAAHEESYSILESITDGFFALDREWRYTYVNAAAERILGRPRAELLGKNRWELFPHLIGTLAESEYRRAMEEKTPVEFEFCYGLLQRYFHINAYPTSQGGLAVYFRDVTDTKKAQAALFEREEQLRIALDTARLGSWHLDLKTYELDSSAQCKANFGLTKTQDLTYEMLLAMIHPDDRPHMEKAVAKAIHGHTDYHTGYRITRPDGTLAWIVASGRAIYGEDGTPLRMVGVTLDNTDRKQAEDALVRQAEALARSNADLQQFAYVTSHDLQEPLRTMISYSQILSKRYGDRLGSDANDFLHYIVSGANRMKSLISALLDYSRIVNVEMVPRATVSLEAVLHWATANLETLISETGAHVTHGELPVVSADQVQLVQLFQNLIQNAIKYRREDAPQIHISAEHGEGHWLIAVQDNGIGIEPAYAERIFGVFKRLHGEELPGTGIGLAIAKRIVEKHGGHIWVESTPGQGSTFFFTLPG